MKRTRKMAMGLLVSAGLLALVMVFSGCQKTETASASGPIDYGATTTGPHPWWVKFEQPVTIHIVNNERPGTPFLPGDDVTKNEWTRAFKEQLNVEVVTDWVSDSSGYGEKLNLAIASNELPDVIKVNPTQFRQLTEAGLVADLTDYMANNASAMVKNIMDAAPTVTDTAKINGRLMGLPRYGYGDLWNIYELWVRHDWMAQSGMAAPKTFDDLEKLMDSFMKAHPGSYGIGVRKNLEEVYYAASGFGAMANIWIDGPDGSIVYGRVQPQMKDALAKFADWYKRGYLRKDFMSIDERDIVGDIAAEKLGIHIWGNWAGWSYVEDVRALGMNAYMEPYEIPGNVSPHVFPLPIDNSEYIVVNKNFRNIPAFLKTVSYSTWVIMEATTEGALTDEQVFRFLLGGEGRHDLNMFNMNDPYGNGPAMVEWAHRVSLNNYKITEPPLTAEWPAQYEQAAPWFRDNSPEGYGRWIQQYAPISSSWINTQIMNEGRFVNTRLTGSMPEDAAAYGSTLDELLTEGFTKIIVGQEPLSYFETVVAEWKASGGDVVTQAINREYGKK